LGAQCILGGPEFTNWESKINAGSSPGSKSWHQNVRKSLHTTHKGGSQEVFHVQSLISRLVGQEEKMVQQLLSVGLALSSICKKARARDRQREVARDKGQWGFVLQGMRPAAEARYRGGQRNVVGDKE
jgi:hypothetical protein